MTGAVGNLGPVWSSALLDAGCAVVGIDLDQADPRRFLRLADEHGEHRIRLIRADVLDRQALDEALRTIQTTFGGSPSILLNNAGIDQPPGKLQETFRFEDLPIEPSRRIMDVNFFGALVASQVFGRAMVTAGHGSIVNVGSLYATVAPDPRFYEHIASDPPFLKPPAYGASKAALINLTRYLATLWGPFGVRVNALSPGGVRGDQDEIFRARFVDRVPLRRMAEPKDLVGPLLFLASEASSYVTGAEILVDGGFTSW